MSRSGFSRSSSRRPEAAREVQGGNLSQVSPFHSGRRRVEAAMQTRLERDALGERAVPADAYYGVQTVRAIENFPDQRAAPFTRTFVRRHGPGEAGRRSGERGARPAGPTTSANAIVQAAREIIDGRCDDQFVVDVFQAGAGTSHNMNANEVIANRALELLGEPRGDYAVVHPNDHVNMAQSTNDVFPTAMRLAALTLIGRSLLPALDGLEKRFRRRRPSSTM